MGFPRDRAARAALATSNAGKAALHYYSALLLCPPRMQGPTRPMHGNTARKFSSPKSLGRTICIDKEESVMQAHSMRWTGSWRMTRVAQMTVGPQRTH